MRTYTLLARNLAWYWRTNLAVLLGVATATGVLGGAALVGESVRASLRDLVLERLGNTDSIVTRNGFFRQELAAAFQPATPVIALEGVVEREASGKRAVGVEVFGMDTRQVLISAALTQELDAKPGDEILLRIPKPSAIPLETLHGRKDDVGKTIRLTLGQAADLPHLSLRPQQGDVRAVYLPLARLQRELSQPGKINTILVSHASINLKQHYTLADVGLRVRTLEKPGCLSLESDSALINDAVAAAAGSLGFRTQPILTYLANAIRVRNRAIPYSVVTALDSGLAPAHDDGITLNDWAARELEAKIGDPVTLEYYVWGSDANLHTETAQFRVERIVPLSGDAADPDFAPDYPGITESRSLRDWDPPFPLDMSRIRPADEQYWNRYRTTPKAFVRLERGRALWGTRFGSLTSIRVFPPSPAFAEALRSALDPTRAGLTVVPVRSQSLRAAQGATDFGEYFVYFSFFLMVSALLLTGLFFKLGIEQRTREIGVLRALGFSAAKIRTLFLLEGAVLAVAGSVAGVAAALLYGALVLLGLRTWWFDAVGTRLLSLHASIPSLALGAAAGVVTGLASVAWTLRGLHPVTPRGLLAGDTLTSWDGPPGPRPTPRSASSNTGGAGPGGPARTGASAPRALWGRRFRLPTAWPSRCLAGAVAALLAAATLFAGQTAGFFGAGALLLIAALLFQSAWLHARGSQHLGGLVALGLRSVRYRPGRSILCIALIASATFVIASLEAFRRDGSSTGPFQLVADSELPVFQNIPPIEGVEVIPFRVHPGDDASCLNLYQPQNPRILAPSPGFLRRTPNPWMLLESRLPGGAVPAIADANSMTYSLHRKLGEEFELGGVRYRIVAALQDSVFQGELLVSEENFLRLFPDSAGYRFFLLSTPPGKADEVARTLTAALSDYGFVVQPTAARLASFHKVENTYLSTFRALGGLGLLLGTVGLAAVLLRNVLERRRELALLRAVGYRPRHLFTMVLAENVFLLLMGLATGAVCAALATAPAVSARGGHVPLASLAVLLALVAATGIVSSAVATAAALGSPLLDALKSE
jgi:ABC-type lipoprotein release transport system permease subunit